MQSEEKPIETYLRTAMGVSNKGFHLRLLRIALQVASFVVLFTIGISYRSESPADRVEHCSKIRLRDNTTFLDNAKPIASTEFLQRRDDLAKALVDSQVDAFILEPGYTFQYYANVSQSDWEPWEPEERPFLMIVQPVTDAETGGIRAKTSYLSPKFEEGRVRFLPIPSKARLEIVTWEEHWNPYDALREGLFNDERGARLMVDEEMRDFIVRGLSAAGFETIGLNEDVAAVRQVKSSAEIEILRAVNTGTVAAVRAMRSCLVPGLSENEVMRILDNTLLSVGFSLFFDLVLFEENAALPHGGFVTGDKILNEDTMILIDVGAHYLGYSSDICRSFFMPPYERNPLLRLWKFLSLQVRRLLVADYQVLMKSRRNLHEEKLKVWNLVKFAQTEAAKRFTPDHAAADVDIAARTIIDEAGYGDMHHRVGHGIGIKAHEAPYLNQANTQKLRPGMTFTNEPGVYLEGRFGVRHEDIYLVTEDGPAELLTGRVAMGPYDP